MTGKEITMTVQGQARAGEIADRGVAGVKSGKTPGVEETPPPGPGELPQTPQEIEGPYFRLGAPQRSNLLEPGDEPESILSARVLNEKGTPIPGALVNFWHCNHVGEYDAVGYRYTGYVVADEAGQYEVTSIIPASYLPRLAKHFHVKVQGSASRSPPSSSSRASRATPTTSTTIPRCSCPARSTRTVSSTAPSTSSSRSSPRRGMSPRRPSQPGFKPLSVRIPSSEGQA